MIKLWHYERECLHLYASQKSFNSNGRILAGAESMPKPKNFSIGGKQRISRAFEGPVLAFILYVPIRKVNRIATRPKLLHEIRLFGSSLIKAKTRGDKLPVEYETSVCTKDSVGAVRRRRGKHRYLGAHLL